MSGIFLLYFITGVVEASRDKGFQSSCIDKTGLDIRRVIFGLLDIY